jgi:hypothetical protein
MPYLLDASFGDVSPESKCVKGCPRRAAIATPVIPWIGRSNDVLMPRRSPSCENNSTDAGAISSCNVQPQLSHLLFRKAASHVVGNDSTFAE